MVTFGPSEPYLFLDLELAKCALMGKGKEEWVSTIYWFGVIANI